MKQEQEKNRIDELFREKLGDYSMPSPDHIWENIAQKRSFAYITKNMLLNGIKKYYVILLLVALGTATTLYFNSNTQPSAPVNGTEIISADQPVKTSNTEVVLATTNPKIIDKNNTTAQPQPIADKQTGNALVETEKTGSAPTSSINRIQPVASIQTHAESGSVAIQEASSVNAVAEKANTGTKLRNNLASKSNVTNTNTFPLNATDNNAIAWAIYPAAELITTPAATESNEITVAGGIGSIKLLTITSEKDNILPGTGSAAINPGGDKNEQLNHNFKIAFAYAPNIVSKLVSATNGSSAEYINKYKASEKSNYSYTIAGTVSYQLNKHWLINTGVWFTQAKNKFSYETPEYFEAYGTKIHNPYTISYNSPVYYSFWDIPLSINYQLSCNKWSIYLNTGAVFNIDFKQEGMMLSNQDELKIVDVADPGTNPYKAKAGTSLLLGFGAAYHLSPNLSLFFEPNTRLGINTLTKSSAPLGIRNNYYSIFGGLRFSLF